MKDRSDSLSFDFWTNLSWPQNSVHTVYLDVKVFSVFTTLYLWLANTLRTEINFSRIDLSGFKSESMYELGNMQDIWLQNAVFGFGSRTWNRTSQITEFCCFQRQMQLIFSVLPPLFQLNERNAGIFWNYNFQVNLFSDDIWNFQEESVKSFFKLYNTRLSNQNDIESKPRI